MPDQPPPAHRLGSIGLGVTDDEPEFVGGRVPDVGPVETAPAPPREAQHVGDARSAGGRHAAPRPPWVESMLDRAPLWLRAAAAPSAAATAWLAVVCVVCVAVTAFTLL